MAIIYSYPEKTSPAGGDFLVITDSEQPAPNKNRTKSLTIDNLASYVTTSTSGITGSGTLNTIAMFTPNGQAIGDSGITQSSPEIIKIGTGIAGGASVLETNLLTCNIISGANLLTIQGNSIIGNEATDILQITSSVSDYTGTASTTAGQVLVSNASSQLVWDDATDVVSGAVAKLIPFQATASAGGSSTYSANNNIVEISWTGGNGTYVLNIPSAAATPYRNIRFVTNSTFPNGASDKVQITAQPGETIDGAAFFEISKVYEGVSLWSNGTEWIVIQAKAH